MNRIDAFTIFAKVGELRSISGAARALGLPKANVSRAVARLEAHYGVALIERTTRNVLPTEIGQRFLDRCRRLLGEIDAVGAEVAEYRGQPSGTLRIGCPAHISANIAPYIPEFLDRFPGIDLRIKVADRVLPESHGFDLVLHIGWLSNSSLIARKFHDVPMGLVASPGFVAANPPIHTPGDLAGLPVVDLYYTDPNATDRPGLPATLPRLELVGPGGRFPLPRWSRFSSNDLAMTGELVRQGLVIAPMAEILMRDRVASGELVRLLPDYWIEPRPAAYAIHAGRATPPPKVRAFIDYVAELGRVLMRT